MTFESRTWTLVESLWVLSWLVWHPVVIAIAVLRGRSAVGSAVEKWCQELEILLI